MNELMFIAISLKQFLLCPVAGRGKPMQNWEISSFPQLNFANPGKPYSTRSNVMVLQKLLSAIAYAATATANSQDTAH